MTAPTHEQAIRELRDWAATIRNGIARGYLESASWGEGQETLDRAANLIDSLRASEAALREELTKAADERDDFLATIEAATSAASQALSSRERMRERIINVIEAYGVAYGRTQEVGVLIRKVRALQEDSTAQEETR